MTCSEIIKKLEKKEKREKENFGRDLMSLPDKEEIERYRLFNQSQRSKP